MAQKEKSQPNFLAISPEKLPEFLLDLLDRVANCISQCDLTISGEEAIISSLHLSADGAENREKSGDGCRATKRKRGTRVGDLRESQQVRAWANMSNVEKR